MYIDTRHGIITQELLDSWIRRTGYNPIVADERWRKLSQDFLGRLISAVLVFVGGSAIFFADLATGRNVTMLGAFFGSAGVVCLSTILVGELFFHGQMKVERELKKEAGEFSDCLDSFCAATGANLREQLAPLSFAAMRQLGEEALITKAQLVREKEQLMQKSTQSSALLLEKANCAGAFESLHKLLTKLGLVTDGYGHYYQMAKERTAV